MSVDGYRASYVAAPASPPPAYEGVATHSKAPLYAAIAATIMSGFGFLAYWFKPMPQETIVYKDKPTIVEKPVYLNKTVEVEKIVYIDKPFVVEKTVYVDKPIVMEKIIEPECPLVAPVECPDPYNGL